MTIVQQPQTPLAHILIVDDTREDLRLLSKLLRTHGYAVRTQLEGRLAINSAQTEPPDLILLDVMMPVMDGYAVCTNLKADTRTSDIPIIFISASGDVVDKVKGFFPGRRRLYHQTLSSGRSACPRRHPPANATYAKAAPGAKYALAARGSPTPAG